MVCKKNKLKMFGFIAIGTILTSAIIPFLVTCAKEKKIKQEVIKPKQISNLNLEAKNIDIVLKNNVFNKETAKFTLDFDINKELNLQMVAVFDVFDKKNNWLKTIKTAKTNLVDKKFVFDSLDENVKYLLKQIDFYDPKTPNQIIYTKNNQTFSFETKMDDSIARTVELIIISGFNGFVDEQIVPDYNKQTTYLKAPGLIRLLNEVNKIKKERGANNVAVVMGGNNYYENNISSLTRAQYTTAALKFLNPVATSIANTDLNWGYDLIDEKTKHFKEYVKALYGNDGILSVNSYLKDGDKNIQMTNNSKIINFGGFKLGLIGAMSNLINFESNLNLTKNIQWFSNEQTANLINDEANKLKGQGVKNIVLLSSFLADKAKENNTLTNDEKSFYKEATRMSKLIDNNVNLMSVINPYKALNVIANNKNNQPLNVVQSKPNSGFVRYMITLNPYNRILKTEIKLVDKLSTSGDNAGYHYITQQDLLNPQKNPDFNQNLITLNNFLNNYKDHEYEQLREKILIKNDKKVNLYSSTYSLSSLGAFISDILTKYYQAPFYNKQTHTFEFKQTQAILLAPHAIRSLVSAKPIKLENLNQILPFNDTLVSGEISVKNLKEFLINKNKSQNYNEPYQFSNTLKIEYENLQETKTKKKSRKKQSEQSYSDNEKKDGLILSHQKRIIKVFLKNSDGTYTELNDNQKIIISVMNSILKFNKKFSEALLNKTYADQTNIRDLLRTYLPKETQIDQKYDQSVFSKNDDRFYEKNETDQNKSLIYNHINESINNKQADHLRIGHWNVLHQTGLNDPKNYALAKTILFNKYDIIGLTEIWPAENNNQEQNNLPLIGIIKYLNKLSGSDDYDFLISDNLKGSENDKLATNEHTSTERIGIIYNKKKVKPIPFANNKIGYIYSNPLQPGKYEKAETDYSRPPFAIKFASIGQIKNDFTLVFGHLDSPGTYPSNTEYQKKEHLLKRTELVNKKVISTNQMINKYEQGSREVDDAERLVKVMEEIKKIDNNKDDDYFFLGDTNIRLHNQQWVFRTLIQNGYSSVFSDNDLFKSSLSVNPGEFSNPYDKIFSQVNGLTISNPSIYNLWNVYEDQIVDQEWLKKVRSLYPNEYHDKLFYIRNDISDHAPTFFDLGLNKNDTK